VSSHLKNIEQSGGLFDPEHGEAERRGSVRADHGLRRLIGE
jgi:hypothetical protein